MKELIVLLIILGMLAKVDLLKKNEWQNHIQETCHYGECLGIKKQIFWKNSECVAKIHQM